MPKASFPSVVPLPCGLLEQIRLPPAIMVLGTSSDAGKSLLAAGLCRPFPRRGIPPSLMKGRRWGAPRRFRHGPAGCVPMSG